MRRAALRELLAWATTWNSIEDYPRLRALQLPWSEWDRTLAYAGGRVACALRLLSVERHSMAKALGRTDAPKGDVSYVIALAKDLDMPLHQLAEMQPPLIEAELAAQHGLVVSLEPRALEDILLAAAEARLVPAGRGRTYTEVFGVCFGSQGWSDANRSLDSLHVNVARVVTQMRAKATANEVTPNDRSFAAHIQIGEKFFPHLHVVGDYHTHPYKTFTALLRDTAWRYSGPDEKSLGNWIEAATTRRTRPHFSLVVAVAGGGKSGKGPLRRAPNVVQLSVRDLFFVIGAYRIRLDEKYDHGVKLEVPVSLR